MGGSQSDTRTLPPHSHNQSKLFPEPCDKVPLGAGTPLWLTTHQRNTTDKKKKLERNENTGAEPTPLAWGVRYTQEGSGWPVPGGRTAMSPRRNSFRPARPACGFKQDFRHSCSQSPAPCCVPPGPSTQRGQQLPSRHSRKDGCSCRKQSRRLLCLMV